MSGSPPFLHSTHHPSNESIENKSDDDDLYLNDEEMAAPHDWSESAAYVMHAETPQKQLDGDEDLVMMSPPVRYSPSKSLLQSLPKLKLVFVGDQNTGKSSIMRRWVDNEFYADITSTIGVAYKTIVYDTGRPLNGPSYGGFRRQSGVAQHDVGLSGTADESRVAIHLCDTAGEERFRSLVKLYFRGAHGILLVVDLSKPLDAQHIPQWIAEFGEVLEPNVPCILVGNKLDKTEERKVSPQELQDVAERFQLMYRECSAKTGQGISEVFDQLIAKSVNLLQQREAHDTDLLTDVELHESIERSRGCRC